ncbi:MAG: DeoR/GlpR family DNA-binding transcription regulator, partial [Pseudoflavonifractor sp.]|nr:DeoR/GlpR family DNA-binding transcription regulator [Pseudoflavonifractor sp.]
ELAHQGLLERTHGGALFRQRKSVFERVFDEKMSLQLEEKCRIAETASKYVEEGDTIFLDSGTTAYQLALCLADKKGLTVITHDLYLAANVEFDPSTTIVLTGGIKRTNQKVLVGGMVEDFISGLRVDTVFLTADAVSTSFGVSNTGFFEAGIKRNLVKAGKRVVLLADHTKFEETAVVKVCDLADIDWIISDRDLAQSALDDLKAHGTKIELA